MDRKKKSKRTTLLSDKIIEGLTVKPSADIEDDHTFGTKPKTLTRNDLTDSDEEVAVSGFRKSNIKLLSDLNKKYEGEVSSTISFDATDSDSYDDSIEEENETSVSKVSSKVGSDESAYNSIDDEKESDESDNEDDKTDPYDDLSEEIEKGSNQDDSGESQVDDSEGDSYDDDEEGYDLSEMAEPAAEQKTGDFQHMKKSNVSEEIKKGNCVRNQLLLWENLLEMRIHMQRCLATANRFPMPDVHKQIKKDGGDDFVVAANKTKTNLTQVLDKLLELQDALLKNNPETKLLSSNTPSKTLSKPEKEIEDSDEEIPSDTEDEAEQSNVEEDETEPSKPTPAKNRKLLDYSKELSKNHTEFTPFRNSVIEKWNEKTRLTSANAHKTSSLSNSVLSQIKFILSDRNKLLRRTQLKRSEFDIIGYTKPEIKEHVPVEANGDSEVVNPAMRDRKEHDEYIPEIFDDSDFYHQLLRELIECKTADVSDPVQLSRQWIALQQMRSKMKRKVDTKATKGRKIKYVVHSKLVNFMAPEKNLNWSDESKNELYSSLFGKIFEGTGGDQNNSVKTTSEMVFISNTANNGSG